VTRETRSKTRAPRVIAAWVLALLVLTLAGSAVAQEVDEEEDTQNLRSLAVQARHHQHWHELTVSFGVLPVDAFLKGLAVSGDYTLHFNDLFAWEIVHAYGVLTRVETELNNDLTNVGIPNPFNYVSWAATSNFVFTPFYGKYSVVNRTQVFTELFLAAGAGYGWMTLAQGNEDPTQHLVVDAGLGFRVFFGEYFSIRFDLRWEGFFLNVEEPRNELWIALGFSVHLG
jgi:outer membrane beta-barrel protein